MPLPYDESIHSRHHRPRSFWFLWQRRLIGCLFRRRMRPSYTWFALTVLAVMSIVAIVWQTVEIGTDLVPPVIIWEPSTITGNNSDFDSMKTVASKCVHEIITSARMKFNHTFDKPKHQRRQILYLHPGPAKTATSTIQALLRRHNNHLNADNIFGLGKNGVPCNFPNPSFTTRQNNRDNKRVMKWQLDEYYDHGVDIIMSSEEMGIRFAYMKGHRPLYEIHRDVVRSNDTRHYDEFFHDVVRSNDWEIRVLIGYRPYFEFAISGFNQQYKGKKEWRKLREWPINGGIRIPLAKSGVLELKSDLVQFPFTQFPFTDELVDFFKPYADRLVVFDITAPNNSTATRNVDYDFTVHFFCDLLEGAENTCLAQRALQASEANDFKSNQAVILDYDRMATAAADRGLMNVTASKLQRAWVGKQIENHMKIKLNGRKLTDLPLVCPTERDSAAINQLYNVSLAQEMNLFPARDPDWEVKAKFDKMMKENKLCNVHVHQILQNAEWKNFFRSLKQEPLEQEKQMI